MKIFISILLCTLPIAAPAQIEVSPAQQCIWSCLYGPGGGDPASEAYNACAAANCSGLAEQESASQAPADPTRSWQSGMTTDGQRFAGADAMGRAGRAGLYYFCHPDGRSYVLVVGSGQGGRLRLDVDGRAFDLDFAPAQGEAAANVPRSSPLVAALRGGTRATVRTQAGQPLMEIGLTGSSAALSRALSGC